MVKNFLRETEMAMVQRKKDRESTGAGATVASTTSPPAAPSRPDGSEEVVSDPLKILCVAYVRTFHQSLMVGLIEATKGVREMFTSDEDNEHVAPSPQADDTEEASPGMSLAIAYDELQATISIVMPEYLKCITKVLNEFFYRYDYEYSLLEVPPPLIPSLPYVTCTD